MQLALCSAAGSGPVGVVFVCGQRLWRLPPQLQAATHALIWPWNLEAVRALVRIAALGWMFARVITRNIPSSAI